MKTNDRHENDVPEPSELRQDLSLRRPHGTPKTAAAHTTNANEHYSREMAVISVTSYTASNQDMREEAPRRNPKHLTGVHRDIRATSTDAEPLPMPDPEHDEPRERTLGESENPAHDFDDDLVEDAYDD
jgi:hypothetical protein